MRTDTTILIEEPPKNYTKPLDTLDNYTRRHRSTTIIILDHTKKHQKTLLPKIAKLKNPQIQYYTPIKKMNKNKAVREFIQKHTTTTYFIKLPAKFNKILRHTPTLTRRLNKLPNTIITDDHQLWRTKKLQEQTRLTKGNIWKNIQKNTKIHKTKL